MAKKRTARALAKSEAKRDIWQEVLDGVKEIKAGGGKRMAVEPRSPVVRARLREGRHRRNSRICSAGENAPCHFRRPWPMCNVLGAARSRLESRLRA